MFIFLLVTMHSVTKDLKGKWLIYAFPKGFTAKVNVTRAGIWTRSDYFNVCADMPYTTHTTTLFSSPTLYLYHVILFLTLSNLYYASFSFFVNVIQTKIRLIIHKHVYSLGLVVNPPCRVKSIFFIYKRGGCEHVFMLSPRVLEQNWVQLPNPEIELSWLNTFLFTHSARPQCYIKEDKKLKRCMQLFYLFLSESVALKNNLRISSFKILIKTNAVIYFQAN